ncbi:hypothetical protein E2C01_060803 [Portunus trituberculatus]|uniref:Uncharacterized protein n=1 Tax=Portunus trituberculatus TaxID=210409 RepID=A0A5B7H943_PORTR|nr:hypothetical protein [Portunus trituberculatus]
MKIAFLFASFPILHSHFPFLSVSIDPVCGVHYPRHAVFCLICTVPKNDGGRLVALFTCHAGERPSKWSYNTSDALRESLLLKERPPSLLYFKETTAIHLRVSPGLLLTQVKAFRAP